MYLTISRNYGPEEIKEKGSRFIAYVYPVDEKNRAEEIIRGLRKKFYDATHVCYAYRIGEGREEYFRYNDDGEPGGTAGMPIYKEIKNKDFYNVMAVVIRYYGGTKLGTGGLARAYGQSARKCLDLCRPFEVVIKKKVPVSFPYDFTGEIMHLVNLFSLDILERKDSAQGVSMVLAVPEDKFDSVARILTDKSSGRINIK